MTMTVQSQMSLLLPRAKPFHSPEVHSSSFVHSSGSFKQQSPQKQSLLSTLQKPSASLSKSNGLHSHGPKSPKSSNNLIPVVQEPGLSSAAETFNQKKRKKKRKRSHSEVEGDTETVTSSADVSQTNVTESSSEKKRKKKKKKRKREDEDGDKAKERECVQSHLDTSGQEEDWCQGGMWSLTSHLDPEQSKQKTQLTATTSKQCETNQKDQGKDGCLVKKKKKKKTQVEALEDTTPACSVPEGWVEAFLCTIIITFWAHILANLAFATD